MYCCFQQDENWQPSNRRPSITHDTAWVCYSSSSSSSSSSTSSLLSSLDNQDAEMMDDKDTPNLPRVLLKPRPRHKWFVVNEVINR